MGSGLWGFTPGKVETVVLGGWYHSMYGDNMEMLTGKMVLQWEAIPPFYRREQTVKRSLQCFLYAHFSEEGHLVIADYFPPRVTDRPVDLIIVERNDPKKVVLAICIDELITLHVVKSLSALDAQRKVIFTTHPLEKKVRESTFFLKPGIEHYHLRGPQAERWM